MNHWLNSRTAIMATRSLRRSRQRGKKRSQLQLCIFLHQHHLKLVMTSANFYTNINHVTSTIPLVLFNLVCLLFHGFSHTGSSLFPQLYLHSGYIFHLCYFKLSPVLKMAEVLQVEFSGVLCQIDGVYILESKQRKQMCLKTSAGPG